MTIKILAFAGSTRKDSYNKVLVKIAIGIAEKQGATVTHVDLADYPMPLYDGDLEEASGLPENAHKLIALFKSHQGLLISAPEYNSSISGVLKNTFDWISRPQPNEPNLVCFMGKVVGLMSASPGGLGGLRGLVHVRSILGNIGCHVIPKQFALANAHNKLDDTGQLINDTDYQAVEQVVLQFLDTTAKLNQ